MKNLFNAWANIVLETAKKFGEGRIGYIDILRPGRYGRLGLNAPTDIGESGAAEIPRRVRLLFERRRERAPSATLQSEIAKLPGVDELKHKPTVTSGAVDAEAAKCRRRLIPTFTFFDPFGYKGLSLQIVNSVIKDWVWVCVFFFNYNGNRRGISNAVVDGHMEALFTKDHAEVLREALRDKAPSQREVLILEHMALAPPKVCRESTSCRSSLKPEPNDTLSLFREQKL